MKKAAVFGASYGVGKAVALKLAQLDFDVDIYSSNPVEARLVVERIQQKGRKAKVLEVDLRNRDGADKAIDLYLSNGPYDGIVYLASPTPDPDAEQELAGTSEQKCFEYLMMNGYFPAGLLKATSSFSDLPSSSFVVAISSDWAEPNTSGPAVFSAAKSCLAKLFISAKNELIAKGIRSTVLYPGDIASFDLDWESPKWDLEDPLDEVISELGTSRIPLVEFCNAIEYVCQSKYTLIREIHLSPISPDYDF